MAIPGKKLAAFAAGGKKAPPFGGGGKKPGGGGGGGGPPPKEPAEEHHDDDEGDHAEPDGDEPDVAAIGERVQDGDGDKRLMKLSRKLDEEDDTAPPWAEDEDKWDKAVELVDPTREEYDEPLAVVAHVYQALGGKIKGDGPPKGEQHEEPEDEADEDLETDEE